MSRFVRARRIGLSLAFLAGFSLAGLELATEAFAGPIHPGQAFLQRREVLCKRMAARNARIVAGKVLDIRAYCSKLKSFGWVHPSINCSADPPMLGGPGMSDCVGCREYPGQRRFERRLERVTRFRPNLVLKCSQYFTPTELGLEDMCAGDTGDDWAEVSHCAGLRGYMAASELFPMTYKQGDTGTLSGDERTCRNTTLDQARTTYAYIAKERTQCFTRLGEGKSPESNNWGNCDGGDNDGAVCVGDYQCTGGGVCDTYTNCMATMAWPGTVSTTGSSSEPYSKVRGRCKGGPRDGEPCLKKPWDSDNDGIITKADARDDCQTAIDNSGKCKPFDRVLAGRLMFAKSRDKRLIWQLVNLHYWVNQACGEKPDYSVKIDIRDLGFEDQVPGGDPTYGSFTVADLFNKFADSTVDHATDLMADTFLSANRCTRDNQCGSANCAGDFACNTNNGKCQGADTDEAGGAVYSDASCATGWSLEPCSWKAATAGRATNECRDGTTCVADEYGYGWCQGSCQSDKHCASNECIVGASARIQGGAPVGYCKQVCTGNCYVVTDDNVAGVADDSSGVVGGYCGDAIVQWDDGCDDLLCDGGENHGAGCSDDADCDGGLCRTYADTAFPGGRLSCEQCDDGNRYSCDGCDRDCTNTYNADGTPNTGNGSACGLVEVCDAGKIADCDPWEVCRGERDLAPELRNKACDAEGFACATRRDDDGDGVFDPCDPAANRADGSNLACCYPNPASVAADSPCASRCETVDFDGDGDTENLCTPCVPANGAVTDKVNTANWDSIDWSRSCAGGLPLAESPKKNRYVNALFLETTQCDNAWCCDTPDCRDNQCANSEVCVDGVCGNVQCNRVWCQGVCPSWDPGCDSSDQVAGNSRTCGKTYTPRKEPTGPWQVNYYFYGTAVQPGLEECDARNCVAGTLKAGKPCAEYKHCGGRDMDGDGLVKLEEGVDLAPAAGDCGPSENSDTLANACRTNCKAASCGDTAQDGRTCDGGLNHGGECSDDNDCRGRVCYGEDEICFDAFCSPVADGYCQKAEACEDGNFVDGDGCDTNCEVSACGNAIAAGGEECDDGNSVNDDYCANDCSVTGSACGDGIVDASAGETCDDSNTSDGDSCTNDCRRASCGDGLLWGVTEQCDDFDNTDGDGCDSDCTLSGCGNAITAGDDECDNVGVCAGGTDPGQPCFGAYTTGSGPLFCDLNSGDYAGLGCGTDADCGAGGICEDWGCPSEGENVGRCEPFNLDGCDWDCEDECGDGFYNDQCYDASMAQFTGEACDKTTRPFSCTVGECVEECDDGNNGSGDGCTASCIDEFCGDGAVNDDPGGDCEGNGVGGDCEQCDDGNNTNDDGCDANCQLECGNGQDDGDEQCDDGNSVSGDGCDAACKIEVCGNLVVQTSVLCDNMGCDADSGNAGVSCASDDDCTSGGLCKSLAERSGGLLCDGGASSGLACTDDSQCPDGACLPKCESCDDGNSASGDGCDANCQLECGNGQVDSGEGCDDGNLLDGDGCDSNCSNTCGNGIISNAAEECDDGNNTPGDGCGSTCLSECGNSVVNSPGEECDDGNEAAGDGCFECTDECGNCTVDSDEQCDDGNRYAADGCDSDCQWE